MFKAQKILSEMTVIRSPQTAILLIIVLDYMESMSINLNATDYSIDHYPHFSQ